MIMDPDWKDNEVEEPNMVEAAEKELTETESSKSLSSDNDSENPEEDRLHCLIKNNKKLLIGKLIPTEPGELVHHNILKDSERKFEINCH